ncbi:hypothetical protein HJG60_009253 [Phyllostomus discolor]|uniref:Integrase catalytic domain-containing protein n=1 Tax=Phyllostomus discolor TaxID=89673 RepID=A0A833YS99_9CHIR|nr:hypothetical protein HJG60_009253 [Phyllostomus discolor]
MGRSLSTRTEKSSKVVKALLKEIIPRFGLPDSIESNNRPAFVSEITQKVSKIVGIKWRLHMAWRPQASGKVGKMKHTLKKNIAKLCQEAHLHWDQAFLIALLRIRVAPRSGIQLSPYKIVYRYQFQVTSRVSDMCIDKKNPEGKNMCNI